MIIYIYIYLYKIARVSINVSAWREIKEEKKEKKNNGGLLTLQPPLPSLLCRGSPLRRRILLPMTDDERAGIKIIYSRIYIYIYDVFNSVRKGYETLGNRVFGGRGVLSSL